MAVLNHKFQFAWYGSCVDHGVDGCADLLVEDIVEINKQSNFALKRILMIDNEGSNSSFNYRNFNNDASNPLGSGNLSKLKCGYLYLISLRSSTNSNAGADIIDIPGLIPSNYESSRRQDGFQPDGIRSCYENLSLIDCSPLGYSDFGLETVGDNPFTFYHGGVFAINQKDFVVSSPGTKISFYDEDERLVGEMDDTFGVPSDNNSAVCYWKSDFQNCFTGKVRRVPGTDNWEVRMNEKLTNINPTPTPTPSSSPSPTPSPTPTPVPTPTPTPTPTETPTFVERDCCDGLSESSLVVNGVLEDKNGVSGSSSNDGKLCWNELSGTALPQSFLCPFEVEDFSKGGLSITITAPLTLATRIFRFESSDGSCYETTLMTTSENNIFNKINQTITPTPTPQEATPTPTPQEATPTPLEPTPTPTPQEPTPTPTPQPPADCCAGLTESSLVTNGQLADKNSVSANANVDGKLCWNTLSGTSLPSSYLCPFETADFSQGGLSITVSAPIDSSNNLFRFETSDGTCYEGNLESTTSPNIFVKAN